MGGSYALKRRAVCSMWSEYTMRENIKEWLEYILDEKMELDENKFTNCE